MGLFPSSRRCAIPFPIYLARKAITTDGEPYLTVDLKPLVPAVETSLDQLS